MKLIESYGTKVIGIGLNEENASLEALRQFQKITENNLNIPVILPLTDGVEKFANYIKENILV